MIEGPLLDRAIRVALDVRAELLARPSVSRALTGQCGLASMQVAARLGDHKVLRTGFFMKVELFCGRRGRYPNRHAWCQIGDTTVDLTATQFVRCRAVHVSRVEREERYVETSSGLDALTDIMDHWCGRLLPEYVRLASLLRAARRNTPQPQELQA